MSAAMLGIPKPRRRVSFPNLVTEKVYNSLGEAAFQDLMTTAMGLNSLLFRAARPAKPSIGDFYTDVAGDRWIFMPPSEWILYGHTDSSLGLEPWLEWGYQA